MQAGSSSLPFPACLCLIFVATAQIGGTAESFLPPAAQIRFEFQQTVLPLPDKCRECLEKRYTKTLEIEGTGQHIIVDGYAVAETCRTRKEFQTMPWEHLWAYQVSLVDKKHETGGLDALGQARVEKTIGVLSRCSYDREADCHIVLFNGARLLLLPDSTGGNCRNCESGIVVSLQPDHMLEVCGNATLSAESNSARVELEVREDCAEETAWLCHAMSPSPSIYCKMKSGKLVPDKEKCLRNWKTAIAENDAKIASLLKKKNAEDRTLEVYCRLLDNYLMGYLAGKEKKALSALKKGLEPFMDDQGRIVMGTDSRAIFSDFEEEVHEVTAKTPESVYEMDLQSKEAGNEPKSVFFSWRYGSCVSHPLSTDR
jgi:hypothetical protein